MERRLCSWYASLLLPSYCASLSADYAGLDIIEPKVVTVNANVDVEEACNVGPRTVISGSRFNNLLQVLLSESMDCLVVVDSVSPPSTVGRDDQWTGLFDVCLFNFWGIDRY